MLMSDIMAFLAGKVAVVTGAGRGIGRTAAVALAEAGADVALGARSLDQLEEVAGEVRACGRRATVLRTDMTVTGDIDALVAHTVSELGGLDIVVNNAGAAPPTPLLETSDADFDSVVALNYRSVFLMMRAAGRHLVPQGSGKVINIASNFAFAGIAGFAAYCSTKAAVVSLTRVAAVEWARAGIQVNALAPGYFATELNAELRADAGVTQRVLSAIPARRMGHPDELAPWIVHLASSASDFMTGETIVIDGGQTAR